MVHPFLFLTMQPSPRLTIRSSPNTPPPLLPVPLTLALLTMPLTLTPLVGVMPFDVLLTTYSLFERDGGYQSDRAFLQRLVLRSVG